MNEKIQHIIQEIRVKKDALNASLNQQAIRVDELEQQSEQLKSDLEQKKSEINQLVNDNAQLKHDITGLQSLLEEAKNQIVNTVDTGTAKPYEQIDELVREIEYCIGQLKNNA